MDLVGCELQPARPTEGILDDIRILCAMHGKDDVEAYLQIQEVE